MSEPNADFQFPDTRPRVCVIMSVYNGSRYLKEQVDSILAQEGVDIHLFVRDDGSTDNTVELLESYPERVSVVRGENKGAAFGFIEASFAAPEGYEYYAFSDADDVWLADKTLNSIKAIEAVPDAPRLAFCRMLLVDDALRPMHLTFKAPELTFRNALVQTSISGAAATLNGRMFEKFRSRRPTKIVMHDAWLYLVATAFGKIEFVEEHGVLYRQHATNVFGAHGGQSAKRVWKRRISAGLRNNSQFRDQATDFLKLFGDELSPTDRAQAEYFASHGENAVNRIQFAVRPRVTFNTLGSEAYYRLLALVGRT